MTEVWGDGGMGEFGHPRGKRAPCHTQRAGSRFSSLINKSCLRNYPKGGWQHYRGTPSAAVGLGLRGPLWGDVPTPRAGHTPANFGVAATRPQPRLNAGCTLPRNADPGGPPSPAPASPMDFGVLQQPRGALSEAFNRGGCKTRCGSGATPPSQPQDLWGSSSGQKVLVLGSFCMGGSLGGMSSGQGC